MILGYTAGVFDLFHIGHVNLLRNSRSLCDRLIVAVSTDELVEYKNKKPVIPFVERVEVVKSCKYVDAVVPQTAIDKFLAWEKFKFDILFVGDDWFGVSSWTILQEKLSTFGVDIVYLPYTTGTSSTLINQTLSKLRLH